MLDNSDAKARLRKLFDIAADAHDGGGRGPLTNADFDEIHFLVSLLRNELPPKVVSLSTQKFSALSEDQRNFGQRVLRALHLVEKYGTNEEIEHPNEQDGLTPTFELPQPEKARVFKLCSDMRKIVFSSTTFDEPHKKRLLNRIAAIEKEVHSPKGKFDVILGGVSDIGETLKKFGTDIKPLTDRMKEVAQITRSGTKEYDQIPAPEELKRLPAPEEETKAE